MNYVQRIRALRVDHDLTQEQLAVLLDKSQQGYSHLENGNAKFSVEDIIILCKYYNVSSDYLLGLTDEYRPLQK